MFLREKATQVVKSSMFLLPDVPCNVSMHGPKLAKKTGTPSPTNKQRISASGQEMPITDEKKVNTSDSYRYKQRTEQAKLKCCASMTMNYLCCYEFNRMRLTQHTELPWTPHILLMTVWELMIGLHN